MALAFTQSGNMPMTGLVHGVGGGAGNMGRKVMTLPQFFFCGLTGGAQLYFTSMTPRAPPLSAFRFKRQSLSVTDSVRTGSWSRTLAQRLPS
jgi:hypothetical protein